MKRYMVTALLAVSATACSFEAEGSGGLSEDYDPVQTDAGVLTDAGPTRPPDSSTPPVGGPDAGPANPWPADAGALGRDAGQLVDANVSLPDAAPVVQDASVAVDASTLPDAAPPPVDAALPDPGTPLVLLCPVIPASGALPVQLACVNEPVLPAMSWSGGPANVGSYVLAHVMRSNHTGITTATWVLADIPPTQHQVPTGDVVDGARLVPGAHVSLNDSLLPVTPATCYAQSRTDELRLYALSVARLPPGVINMQPATVLGWLEQSGSILARYTLPAHFP